MEQNGDRINPHGNYVVYRLMLNNTTYARVCLIIIIAIGGVVHGNVNVSKCNLAEFRCGNGQCISIDRYCNHVNDCVDSSDEPRYCSPCNRTYFGEVGRTYSLEIHRPSENTLPFICYLTFNANGSRFGDIVQLTFESFTLGKSSSIQQTAQCSDRYLQINESGRPHLGGSWCGTIWTPVTYFSETRSVTVSVFLLKLPLDQSGYSFDFKLEYKLLRKENATVRFGNSSNHEHYLGELISGTYCSRIFTDCSKRNCYLQSPNFPGIYPRNLTCYYAIRQNEIPSGKHAMISIRQQNGQLISVRSTTNVNSGGLHQEQNILKVWDQCNKDFDFVTVYDGYTTRDPVILKFCGGGEPVPETISSSHELLVEFTTSPYGSFDQSSLVQTLHGFELEVQVKFVDQKSANFVRNQRLCEFWIRGTDRGILESPKYSLIPNTTFLYHLQGINFGPEPLQQKQKASNGDTNSVGEQQPWKTADSLFPPQRYRVWLSVIKFHVASPFYSEDLEHHPCTSHLNVWDGYLTAATNCNDILCEQSSSSKNLTLLGRYCKDHSPKSCDHFLLGNKTRFPRPCSMSESYLSTGDSLTLELKISESTSLRPVSFRALYEFVDFHLDGESYEENNVCSRIFSKKSGGFLTDTFQSPKNIFMFGRGGSKNLNCIYRFEANPDERIQLTLSKVVMNSRGCKTHFEPTINRYRCQGYQNATLAVFELPWEKESMPLIRHCFCGFNNQSLMPFTLTSTSHIIELKFTVNNMTSSDDFSSFYFQGVWKFIKAPNCKHRRKLSGSSGEVRFEYLLNESNKDNCENYPWLIVPNRNKYLYAKITGMIMSEKNDSDHSNCVTKNRIVLSSKNNQQLIICPHVISSYQHRLVEFFSDGWTSSVTDNADFFDNLIYRSLIVEFVAHETASYSLTWIELSKRKIVYHVAEMVRFEDDCFRCPEFDACLNLSIVCDGTEHCPSGFDESLNHCSLIFQLPLSYFIIAFIFIFLFIVSTITIFWKMCGDGESDENESKTHLGNSLSSDLTAIHDSDIVC